MIVVDGNDNIHEITPYCFDCGATEDDIEVVKRYNYAVLLRCMKCGNSWSKKLTEKNLISQETVKKSDINYSKGEKQYGVSKN